MSATTPSTAPPIPATTSRAVIDLGAIAHNAAVLARAAGTAWMAVVKADAYGHGLEPVARACLGAGATWLGVAQLAEALHLRSLLDATGIARPAPALRSLPTPDAPRILTWLAPVLTPEDAAAPGSPLRAAIAADLDLSVSTPDQARAIAAAADAEGRAARVHLKVDTGMSRAGTTDGELPALASALVGAERAGSLVVVGLWSHLSRADEPDSGSTEDHLARFRAADAGVTAVGLAPVVRHLAATGGLLWHPDARLDLVRAGIGLYGLSPDPAVATSAELGLRPTMRLEAPLALVKRIPAGQAVSYGGTWTAPTSRWVGLVPLGYADGIPRAASGAPVTVIPSPVGSSVSADAAVPPPIRTRIVGRVCMDQVVIDLGPAARAGDTAGGEPPARAGDTAVLWGDGADPAGIPTVDEWAAVCGTINYEIVTRLGARVPRIYLGVDWEDRV
ncbi:alanine racemase [Actinomyces gaoshouyii]|uniref:alanine racemase n=1 Tax=Actinomyces gaoshouyii TaxID=1960083 RepID=UPI0009BE6720|nr:alanine racemase [Actinomyces gaoshouyii]ARD42122.1 alanine racemase [Actinomyces gaoshouyii]